MFKFVCADTFAIEMESLYLIKEYLPSCRCTLDVLSVMNLSRGLFFNWKCCSHCAFPSRVVSNSLFSLPLRELMMFWLLKIVLLPMNDAGRFQMLCCILTLTKWDFDIGYHLMKCVCVGYHLRYSGIMWLLVFDWCVVL